MVLNNLDVHQILVGRKGVWTFFSKIKFFLRYLINSQTHTNTWQIPTIFKWHSSDVGVPNYNRFSVSLHLFFLSHLEEKMWKKKRITATNQIQLAISISEMFMCWRIESAGENFQVSNFGSFINAYPTFATRIGCNWAIALEFWVGNERTSASAQNRRGKANFYH